MQPDRHPFIRSLFEEYIEMYASRDDYYRASSSVGKQGTDLGYFSSRSVVEVHGGTLVAKNLPKRSLAVSLRLPFQAGLTKFHSSVTLRRAGKEN